MRKLASILCALLVVVLLGAPVTQVTVHAAATKIIFNANGGTGTMKSAVLSDSYKIPNSTFKKAGFTFAGWSEEKTVTQLFKFYSAGATAESLMYSTEGKASITLYAIWVKPGTYTITYAADPSKLVKAPANAPKKYTSGKATKLPEAVEIGGGAAGISFDGYQVSVNGKVLGFARDILPACITGNIILTPFASEQG